jgi:hypothetical protein
MLNICQNEQSFTGNGSFTRAGFSHSSYNGDGVEAKNDSCTTMTGGYFSMSKKRGQY